ncbi:MAG: FecR domain-containing protein [Archangiaceae bacterium]|nr:FecR domain-containing protein [Archangiaceae bacterium]
MNEPDYVQRAAELLSSLPVPEAPEADPDAARADVAAMQVALEERRTARPRWVLRAALAAGLVLVAGAALLLREGGAVRAASVVASPASVGSVTTGGQAPQRLQGGVPLAEASRVSTPMGGTAALDFSTGTHLELAEGSELSLDALGARQRLHLASGRVRAQVAHVEAGRGFVIETRDAEVEVRGTRFTVEVVPRTTECAHASSTRVSVEEGVVAVRAEGREVSLHAGDRWPRECFVEPAAAEAAALSGSSLGAQNDLFAQAVALKRSGDQGGAISLFEHLMEAWPHGPLAESAEVERMKLLGSTAPARATAAARAYLARHPHGFARAEAEALARAR